jgi:hypothetical protein
MCKRLGEIPILNQTGSTLHPITEIWVKEFLNKYKMIDLGGYSKKGIDELSNQESTTGSAVRGFDW